MNTKTQQHTKEPNRKSYASLPTPKRGDEEWRFASLKQLDFEGYTPAAASVPPGEKEAAKALAREESFGEAGVRLTIVNDTLLSTSGDSELPEGVICLPLSQAMEEHPDLVQQHFMQREAKLGSAKFAALHAEEVKEGLFLYVPDGVEISKPVEVCHISSGEKAMTFPHTLIVLGENAKATVIDRFLSLNDEDATWSISVNDLVAGEGSALTYLALQELNLKSRAIQINNTTVAARARAKAFLLNTGARWARQESISALVGEESHSDMLAISLPISEQEFDQRTFQHHISPHAYSDLLYKNTLFDKTRTVFSGLIYVDEKAHFTDAYQTCRNILLSEEAEANSLPGLEINADQVKCSHGSTSACLSQDEVHYLMSRGIDEKTSKRLVARGFSVEVVERLEDETLEEHVLALIDRKFAQHH